MSAVSIVLFVSPTRALRLPAINKTTVSRLSGCRALGKYIYLCYVQELAGVTGHLGQGELMLRGML